MSSAPVFKILLSRFSSSLFLSLVLSWAVPFASEAAAPVVVATYEGVINPVAAEYFHDALGLAEAKHAQALVFRLDTPGGLDTSMRLMIKDMTGA